MKKLMIYVLALVLLAPLTPQTAAAVVVPPARHEDPRPAEVKSALEAFKSLSRKERKQKIRQARQEIKAFKAARKAGQEPSTNTLLLVILAILLPPLAVYLHQGEINNKFWISLLLTLLFWLPGVIYALIVILGDNG